ncbi:hypothetical protein [Yersinia ruckeri]|uniref:hypothetical protein n=1 Tax=Yersinia ruckeri TaxID=29486 RepID=UPI001F325D56|nr:hypothetical protein [Yersinia ruckeri]UIN02615.1 hypothetical protein LGL91_18170 [Yersinia ruckeri]
MLKRVFVSSLFLSLFLLSGCDKGSEGPSIAVVDVNKLMVESDVTQKANEHLSQVRTILQKGLSDAEKTYKEAPEETQKQQLTVAFNQLQQQFLIEQKSATAVVEKAVVASVDAWKSGQKKYLFVLPTSSVLSYPKQDDVTAEIVTLLNKKALTFADLPSVKVNTPTAEGAASKKP